MRAIHPRSNMTFRAVDPAEIGQAGMAEPSGRLDRDTCFQVGSLLEVTHPVRSLKSLLQFGVPGTYDSYPRLAITS